MYPEGYDVAWFATDVGGNVGAFISAGSGPIPATALGGSEDDVLDLEEKMKGGTGRRGGYELHVDVPRPDDFIDLAERGFFVFDWNGVTYTLVASPLNPLFIGDLGPLAERVRTNLLLADLSTTRSFEEKDLGACVRPTC